MGDTSCDVGQVVAAAWARALGVEHADRDADFFDLGGDSLAAARVCAAIQARTGQSLTLQQFVDNRTMRGLTSLVESMPRHGVPAARGPADQAGPSVLPVLPAQEIYLRRDDWSKKSGVYDNGHAVVEPLRFRGRLDAGALAAAVAGLGRHHAALRARFGAGTHDDYAIWISGDGVRLRIHDADNIEQVWKAFDRAHRTWRDRPSGVPLSGFHLYRLAEDDHILIMWVDHMMSDSWSFGVLIEDLATLYNAALKGLDSPLRGDLTYERFHADRIARQQSDEAASARAFWMDALNEVGPDPDIDFLGAPRGVRPPAEQQDTVRIAVPPDVYAPTSALPGATPFSVFSAAVAMTLGRHSGRTHIGIISSVALRRDPAIERLVGWVSNSIVIPVGLDPRATLRELLSQVCSFVISAQDNGACGRNSLIRELDPGKFGVVRRHAGVFLAAESTQADDSDAFDGLETRSVPWTRGFSRHGITCILLAPAEAAATIGLEAGWLGERRRQQLGGDLGIALRMISGQPAATVGQAMSAMSGPDDWSAGRA
jgi:condensation domain-containing protein/phosphopantetheine binding protein